MMMALYPKDERKREFPKMSGLTSLTPSFMLTLLFWMTTEDLFCFLRVPPSVRISNATLNQTETPVEQHRPAVTRTLLAYIGQQQRPRFKRIEDKDGRLFQDDLLFREVPCVVRTRKQMRSSFRTRTMLASANGTSARYPLLLK